MALDPVESSKYRGEFAVTFVGRSVFQILFDSLKRLRHGKVLLLKLFQIARLLFNVCLKLLDSVYDLGELCLDRVLYPEQELCDSIELTVVFFKVTIVFCEVTVVAY